MCNGAAQQRIIFAHFNLYSKKSLSKGAKATVGFFLDKQTSTLYYAVSWCSPKDKFVKKEGIRLVSERIKDNVDNGIGLPNFVYSGYRSYYEVCHTLLKLDTASTFAPNWAKQYKFTEADLYDYAGNY